MAVGRNVERTFGYRVTPLLDGLFQNGLTGLKARCKTQYHAHGAARR